MNWLFRIFVLLGLLVVIALFSALLAPYFISWERFTASFEEQASRIVGQPVKVGGKSNLRLLPLPFVSFENLDVGRNEDGSPLMTVERFSLNMELFPFLSGEVRIVEMAMQRPQVNLKVAENGTIAWTSPREVLVNPEQINIEKITVENGSMSIDGLAGDRQLSLENVEGVISARSILGPWKIDASTDIENVPTELKISTGTYQESERSLRLKVETARKDQPYKLLMDGPVKLEDDVLNWSGEFALTPFSESRRAQMIRPVEPLPVTTEGDFSVSPKTIEIPAYRMEVGNREDPYTITGYGQVNIQDEVFFRFVADGRQIDLDRLEQVEEAGTSPTFESRIAVLRSVLERIPVPGGKGEINAILPAIVAGDTFIRDVKTLVRPRNGGWDLRSFSATFPGNTKVEAKGRLGLFDQFGFSGELLIASRQPSGLASWMSGDVDAQIRRLKALGLSSDVTLSPRQTVLDRLELRLDDAVLRGRLRRVAPTGERAALFAELAGNRVNIQDLRALYSLTRSSGEDELASHDLDIRVNADVLEAQLTEQPVVAGKVNAHVRVKSGNVSIEQLNAEDFYGSAISSSGRLENLLTSPNGNFKLGVKAKEARQLLQFVEGFTGEHFIFDALQGDHSLTADTELELELDTRSTGQGSKGQLLINGKTGGTGLNVRLAFDGQPANPTEADINLNGTFLNPSTSLLMRQFAIETMPEELVGEMSGPFKFNASLKGSAADGFETNLALSSPSSNVAANGDLNFISPEDADFNLDVTVGSGDLLPYLTLAGIQLPDSAVAETMPASIKFKVSKKNPLAKFTDISAQIAGNTAAGTLDYQFAELQRPRISGALELSRLSAPILSESVYGFSNILGVDVLDENPDREFQVAGISGLDANVKVKAQKIDTGFGFSGNDVSTTLVMLDGAIDLNDLKFNALGGAFSGAAGLKNVEGTVVGTLQYSLKDADILQLRSLTGMPQFMNGRVSMNGTADTNGRSKAAMLSNLAGNGIVSFSNVQINGIDPLAFSNLLLEADVEGFEVDSEKITELVEDTVLVSGFAVDFIDTPFSISRGRAKIRNLVHQTDEASFSSTVEVDISNADLNATAAITYKPGRRDAIAGTDPVVALSWNGSLEAPVRDIDASQLEAYLTLRAFENSQRRVETLEAGVIEKQRIQREIAFNFAREQYKVRQIEEEKRRLEAEKLKAEEEERKRLEEAARKLEEERARLEEAERLRAEAARRLEEEQKAKELARLEALRKAEEARRQEELRKAEEAARQEKIRQAEEAARLEELRRAEEAKRQENARKAAAEASVNESSSGIVIQDLPPPEPSEEETISPSLRESIIQNIESFLQGN